MMHRYRQFITTSLIIIITLQTLSISLYKLEASAQLQSYWEEGEEMPTYRTEIAGDIIDGKIYVIGGADYQGIGVMDIVEIYDTENDEWSKAAPLPYPLDHTAAITYDGKLYVIGGFLEDKVPTDKVLIYDPEQDEWTEGTPLPSPRGALTAEVINGTIYAVGGIGADHLPVQTNEAYEINTDTWSSKTPLPGPKHHLSSAVVDGKLHVLGGRLFGNGEPSEINESLTSFDDNLRYDPETDKWTSMESMLIRRSGFSAVSLNNEIFVFGGQGPAGAYDSIERYDPETNKWVKEPNMPSKRSGLVAVPHDDRVYVFGGQFEGLQARNVNEIFYPNFDDSPIQ